jgi:hypothetical protein
MPEVEGFVNDGIKLNNLKGMHIIVLIKQQQLNPGGGFGKQREVDALRCYRCPQGLGKTWR